MAEATLGAGQLLEQPRVRDRRRRVVGQRAKQRHLGLLEVIDPRRVGAERPEDLAVVDERRSGHRAHVRDGHDPIGRRRVREAFIAPVVAGDNDLAGLGAVAE
jgi:hypothetical protein